MKTRIVIGAFIIFVAGIGMGKERDITVGPAQPEAQKPELVIQNGHFGWVSSVSFSPDGKTLASGSPDTTIKFWDVKEGKIICTLLPLDKQDWVAYTPDGYFDASENGKKFIGWTIGLTSYGAEQFWDQYYRPGLLGKLLRGEKIK